MRRQSYREDLVDAIGHPSAVSPDAEQLQANALRARLSAPSTINRFDRAHLVRSARSTSSRAPRCRRHATLTLIVTARGHHVGALRAHSTESRTSATSSQGCPWSTSNVRCQRRSRFRSRAVGNWDGDEWTDRHGQLLQGLNRSVVSRAAAVLQPPDGVVAARTRSSGIRFAIWNTASTAA
jgi:hypothetical protein